MGAQRVATMAYTKTERDGYQEVVGERKTPQ